MMPPRMPAPKDSPDVSDQVFIVTGGGGAIARPIVERFSRAGAKVVVVERALEHARARAAEVGGLAVAADLTRAADAAAMVTEVLRTLGRLDGLIHTVGGFVMGALADADEAQYDRMFDVNVRTL